MPRFTGLLLCSIAMMPAARSEIIPHPLFSDHCVLQQGEGIPIWGTAAPGEPVRVRFRGREFATRTTPQGRWSLDLETGSPGGPFILELAGEGQLLTIEDVLVGDVWWAGGQSNMERGLGRANHQKPIFNAESEAAKADYPGLRQFQVQRLTAAIPAQDLGGQWIVCSPETAWQFSAVAFFFGRDLIAARGEPIGLIHSSWGGSPVEAWMSREALEPFPEYSTLINQYAAQYGDAENAETIYARSLADWFTRNDPLTRRDGPVWDALAAETASWSPIALQGPWEREGHAGFDGVAWYRRPLTIPEAWRGRPLTLELGPIDDFDTTWVNQTRIGETNGWARTRAYTIPPEALQSADNWIWIRVLDTAGGGGIWDVSKPPRIHPAGAPEDARPLAGKWQLRESVTLASGSPLPPNPATSFEHPTALFNGMVAPCLPFAIRGAIWYQAESNAAEPARYRELFPAMVADWRARWGRGDFPFLYVQVAPFKDMPPEVREAQRLSLAAIPHAAMVSTIDLGDPEDIHPPHKEPVGERLALAARALAYGESIVYSGPHYSAIEIDDDRAILSFEHVGPGLVAANGPRLFGFTIAGDDGIHHPADARIEGDHVIVTSPQVPHPRAVRYAWANLADGNLYNRAGLPAPPFSTQLPRGW